MAEISVDYKNIIGAKKCAVSTPRIVSLEIDESPSSESDSGFCGFFHDDQVSPSDVKSYSNSTLQCDKQSNANVSIQSSFSNSTFGGHPSDKIKSTNDVEIDFDLLDLLNSTKLEGALESCVSQKNICDDTMKIISNVEVGEGTSSLLSMIDCESSEKDEGNATVKYCPRKNTQNCDIDFPDFGSSTNKCAEDSLLSKNPSLKVEGNLSDLLSSLNIGSTDVTKNSSLKVEGNLSDLLSSLNIGSTDVTEDRNFNSSSICNSKVANHLKTGKEPYVTDLSDLLSTIDFENFNDNKLGSYIQGNACNTNVVETNVSCLADLLSSIDIEKSNEAALKEKPCVSDLSDLLSSIDLEDCKDNKVNMCNTSVVETKNELSLADLLSFMNIDKSDKPEKSLLNNKPLNFVSFIQGNNSISDSLKDYTLDAESSSSSSNSCASSYSETENNSPKDSSARNNLTIKTFESDSGYNSFNSGYKEFSFFDYSTSNQFSFNTFLTKKSDVNISAKDCDSEDFRNTNEEMSMSDLLTIVSPEFKHPDLATLNEGEKLHSSLNKDHSGLTDLIESLNIKSENSDPDVINKSVEYDEKLINYASVDGQISKKDQSCLDTINFQVDGSLEKDDILIPGQKTFNDDNIASDDEQTIFIDLRECIKSAKHQFTPKFPIKKDKSLENQRLECFHPNKILFCCEEKHSSDLSKNSSNLFEFNDTYPKNKPRVNTKQTLFSKALACKPRKDQSLLQKVANIKKELLNNLICRPVFIDSDVPKPIIEPVVQSDKCIMSNEGRKSFGMYNPCELQ